jgi:hypothetical protein
MEPIKTCRSFRFSIVFVLRAHSPVQIDTDKLTTPITGTFQHPLTGITAGELFGSIQGAHFNINTQIQERDEQRRRLAEKKQNAAPSVPTEGIEEAT